MWLDPPATLTTSDLDTILCAVFNSGTQGLRPPTYSNITLDYSGQVPPAPPSNQALAYIYVLQVRQWLVNTDPRGPLTASDVEAVLTGLVGSYCTGSGTVVDLRQTPPITPTNISIANAALLQASGWSVILDPPANLATSDVDAILAQLAAHVPSFWYFWTGNINVSGQTPPAPPTDTADLATLTSAPYYWTIVTD